MEFPLYKIPEYLIRPSSYQGSAIKKGTEPKKKPQEVNFNQKGLTRIINLFS